MTDDEERVLARLREAFDTLDRNEAELARIAADESLPSDVRLNATMGQLYIQGERRGVVPAVFETLIHLAYGVAPSPAAEPPTPDERQEAIAALITYGIATRKDVETLPMETVLAQMRERTAKAGFADTTGQAG